MLELRPTCENCNKALAPDSLEARICTYECTFCATCVDNVLENICPNCGGGFVPRPIRPSKNWKGDNYLGKEIPRAVSSNSSGRIKLASLSDYDFVFPIHFPKFQSDLALPRQADLLGDEIGGDRKFTPTAIDQHREMNSSRPA